MDLWSALAVRIGAVAHGVEALDLLRLSLERWLDGAPGYASGRSSNTPYLMEDEYLMTGVGCTITPSSLSTPDWLKTDSHGRFWRNSGT